MFQGETPIAAWQTMVDGHSAVRSARLEGEPMTTTFTAGEGEHAILDDLVIAPSGASAIAWSTIDGFGGARAGFVATARAGDPFADALQLPGGPAPSASVSPMSRRACSPPGACGPA